MDSKDVSFIMSYKWHHLKQSRDVRDNLRERDTGSDMSYNTGGITTYCMVVQSLKRKQRLSRFDNNYHHVESKVLLSHPSLMCTVE